MATERAYRRPEGLPTTCAIVTAGCVATLLPLSAAADSMRCGSRIVKEEDTIDKVVEVCGEPVRKQRTWIQRAPQFEWGGNEYSFPGREDVPVDLWIYDFGSHKLKMKVRFVAGKVQSITPLD